jgi:hypothetical protein
MLTALLHRKRKAINEGLEGAAAGVDETRRLYGGRLFIRGLVWLSIYALALGVLEVLPPANAPLRIAVALLPMPFFAWYLWSWMRGVARMDELARRIELEALGFACPATLVVLMTIGLLDRAVRIEASLASFRSVWLVVPVLYYIGLWRARRRYA